MLFTYPGFRCMVFETLLEIKQEYSTGHDTCKVPRTERNPFTVMFHGETSVFSHWSQENILKVPNGPDMNNFCWRIWVMSGTRKKVVEYCKGRDATIHMCRIDNCLHACMLRHLSYVWLCATLWTVPRQASLSMGFSRQEYWCGLLCSPPGIFPAWGLNPGLLLVLALAGMFFITSANWEALGS